VELGDTPFFAQTAYRCGPAAAATVLSAAGLPATPDELAPATYLPARRGTLQAELLASIRRRGGLPFVIAPDPAALQAELLAGRPVLVLQNLGLEQLPVWHYAVVIGVTPESNRVVLRSGTEPRHRMNWQRFMQTWDLAERWGLIVLRPGELPADPDPIRFLRASAALESVGLLDAAQASYVAALERWPAHPLALLGLANAAYARGDYRDAASRYRQLLAREPSNAIARNNLAETLVALGCPDAALNEIERALDLPAPAGALRAALEETRRQIVAAPREDGRHRAGCRP
jgi:tetratricopeptide (TPR) repeat protein